MLRRSLPTLVRTPINAGGSLINWADKRVLVTQSRLFSIAGSEVVTFEMAEHFSRAGAEVIVATFGFSDLWKSHFEGLERTSLVRMDDPQLDVLLRERPVDLAWVHHQVIPEALLRSPSDTQIVFHHMSSFLPEEFAIHHEVEALLADVVVFPAQETLDRHRASGLLNDLEPNRLRVFGNPAPDKFRSGPREPRTSPRNLLVISNHIPPELVEALQLVSPDCAVTFRGDESNLLGR